MDLEQQILNALRQAIADAGGKPALAKKLGLTHSVINRFENGTCRISNMTIGTLEKLFPNLRLAFNNANFLSAEDLTDDTTRLLLTYWQALPPSKRFEILAKVASYAEQPN